LDNFGSLVAMTWDAQRDCFWVLYANGKWNRLRRYSASGEPAKYARPFRLPVPIQPGARNGVVLQVAGDNVVIFTPKWSGRRSRQTDRSFVVDPIAAKIVNKYTLREFPRLPAPARSDLPLLWTELTGLDCYSAMQRLGRGRDDVVDFLSAQWNKLPTIDPQEFRLAIRDLKSSDSAVRARAGLRLSGAGHSMRASIEEAIDREESAEVRMTLTWVLEDLVRGPNLQLRLDHVLAAIGTEKAATLRKTLRLPAAR